jgi:Uma2 family endonuclease
MSAQTEDGGRLTWGEFLRFQQAYTGEERFVWDDGHVVLAMTGGTERHDLVVMTLARLLMNAYEGTPCEVFAHNRQIKTARRSYYPDVLVRCGKAVDPLYETDARFLIEILSPSNGPAERTQMLFDYQTVPSVEVILLVDTRRRVVTVHRREDKGWTESEIRGGEVFLGALIVDFDRLWVDVDERSSFD